MNAPSDRCLPHGHVLLVGGGAREHALAARLLASPQVTELFWHAGQPLAAEWLRAQFPQRRVTLWTDLPADAEALASEAACHRVDLAVIGPERPLAEGWADTLRSAGIATCGPGRSAARLEASKRFAKSVMQAAGVATPNAVVATSRGELAAHLASLDFGQPWVVKADGLAQGKGVQVCPSPAAALRFGERWLAEGHAVLVEPMLRGRELSWLAFCDGERCALLEPACDCKTLVDGGLGPNTGGMGAWSPPTDLPNGLAAAVRRTVFEPMLAEMRRRDAPFRGVLYAGLMLTENGLQVLEFNVRFGDPEAQVLLARLRGDLVPWLWASATGGLDELPADVPMDQRPAVYVVAAAAGYPDAPRVGDAIGGLDPTTTFVAGIARGSAGLVTTAGRVAGVLGRGDSLHQARVEAYRHLTTLHFAGRQVRWDVGLAGPKRPVVVLASGRGSNFNALVAASRTAAFPGKVVALVCDRADAPVLDVAARLDVPAHICRSDTDLLELLNDLQPALVALAGYRKVVPDFVLAHVRQHGVPILNIHPSLLPDLPGLHAYRRAFAEGRRQTGVTVHDVVEELDAGRVLAQVAFDIDDLADPEAVEQRGLAVEHALYPQVVARVLATLDLPMELRP